VWRLSKACLSIGKPSCSNLKEENRFGIRENDTIFMQGQPADSLYFLMRGKVKARGGIPRRKERLSPRWASEFFGEGCLAGQTSRMATAIRWEIAR